MRSQFARSSVVLSALVVLFGFACTTTQTRAPVTATSSGSVDEAVQVTTVPAGRAFDARLDQPLSSVRARPQELIWAHLVAPLVSDDGRVVAARGAELRGHVVAVDRDGVNRIALQFDGVVINGRLYPVHAQLIHIESARVVAREPMDPEVLAVDVYPPLPAELTSQAIGGGPPPVAIPVELPAETNLHFYLTKPLSIAPQTSGSELQNSGEVDETFGE